MAFEFKRLLDLSPQTVSELTLPYISDVDDSERLKGIIQIALNYLVDQEGRSKAAMLVAWEDTARLYQWFFDQHETSIRRELDQQLVEQSRLLAYIDTENYIDNEMDAFKRSYIGEVDVLNAILKMEHYPCFVDVPCVKSDFSNAEFYCVMALYMASMAIESLAGAQAVIDDQDYQAANALISANDQSPAALEVSQLSRYVENNAALMQHLNESNHALVEAQIAIDQATYYGVLLSTEFDDIIKATIAARQKKLAATRFKASRMRQEFAWKLFHKERPKYSTDTETYEAIADEVQRYGREVGADPFADYSAPDSIRKSLANYKKKLANDKRK